MRIDFDAAIFDMDGTLLNTMPYWRFTTMEYALKHGWPVFADIAERMYRTSSRKLTLEYGARLGIEVDYDAAVHELEGFMNRHYIYDAALKDPALPEFLDMLRAHGVKMCVATGAPRQFARNGLRRNGILDRFEFVTDNYETPLTKDKPGYFDHVCARLGVKPERCMVFEDALYAMESAKASGCRVCAIEDDAQLASRDGIKDIADIYIKSYRELMD